ncbi:AAA family ATPase [Mycobacterium barrassiae]|uniref:AAA family ATPase n=1 Tax=Mycobacterium barrassiae TaxID=319709 RepID=UPI0022657FC1|nr:AAA family ATPase [Mycobacterium barrassiae]MCV7300664.1 AAA family ATPase [Mycobacterium barrassiae]
MTDPYDFDFNNPTCDANFAAIAEADAVDEQRLRRWGASRFALGELRGRGESLAWARKVVHDTARTNAGADPITDMPKLMATGDALVKAGATDAEMAGLHALTPAEIAKLQLESAAFREDRRAQVRTLARKIAADRETTVAQPEPCLLSELLDEPDESATYRIGEVWPTGGRVLLAAQFKSGKSTLVGNTVRSLVDGEPFLGTFPVSPVGKVVLIDTELDRRTLRRWLHDQGIRNTSAVTVVPLRGAVSTFDILDARTRTEWAQRLGGADVVILDCLRPVLDALGLSEDKDAGKLLVAFDALLAEVGATEGLVVTHMGHQNERARGDSRLLDWPDALWKITRDGDDTDDDGTRRRYLSAMGRDVDLPEGALTFDADTRHLSFGCGGRADTARDAAISLLLEMVDAAPGELSKNAAENQLMDDHGVTQKDARKAIARAIKAGMVTVTSGRHRGHYLSPVAVNPYPQPAEVFNFMLDSEGR